jgi:hypothetical protein
MVWAGKCHTTQHQDWWVARYVYPSLIRKQPQTDQKVLGSLISIRKKNTTTKNKGKKPFEQSWLNWWGSAKRVSEAMENTVSIDFSADFKSSNAGLAASIHICPGAITTNKLASLSHDDWL